MIEDRAWLRAQIERLVRHHEATQPHPWAVSDAPADFIERQLGAIVGLEVPLVSLTGKWKVSQNRPAADRAGVFAGLQRQTAPAAPAMAAAVAAAHAARDPD